ncbi:16S rRNA (cytidine(1402)-2'-O)-methyltransferase [Saliniradius amylolyticus]|uniref:Ribosomal RNA small subunit methyltransferase I n=1 Tax=Saliniradius amylolyticus TaxID=2183582 RepID=A0A2S2E5K3_9ALTE|nr:16S rRNA (cytidine(1402)-2'-O)-methyltransferase [Saliniradius amylolyticus]AWL12934.1 16S rRNA (cytidine(1402)-2'-O)-methyltransferase [Saliniradius amylolyticus]
MNQSATLYIVATPIGHLGDISQRAAGVLAEVAVIAAEDTRHTQKLLQHLQVQTPLLSLHEHNESQRAGRILERLNRGDNVALVSDAGTPLISDPGYELVRLCRQHGVKVSPIPGACAAIAALSASGLPTHGFHFSGFLPVKQQARTKVIESLADSSYTTVFYEAPRRIRDTVAMLVEVLGGDRRCVLAKELTKTFETFVGDTAAEILDWLDADPVHQKGEFVLMVGPAEPTEHGVAPEAKALLTELTVELPLKKAAAITARHYGLKKNVLYNLGLELGL